MHWIKTNRLELAFEAGGRPDGPPVLLLHGWPDDVRGWRGVTPWLEEAGYRWVAPWLRGFGPTRFRSPEIVRDGTSVTLAADAFDLADALGWGVFSVVGHDWGGRAGYQMAALQPERIAALTSLAIGTRRGAGLLFPISLRLGTGGTSGFWRPKVGRGL